MKQTSDLGDLLMRLLNTLLLSTSLLMSVPFASDLRSEETGVVASANAAAESLKLFKENQVKNIKVALLLLERDAEVKKEVVGLTDQSTFIDILKEVRKFILASVEEKKTFETKLETATNLAKIATGRAEAADAKIKEMEVEALRVQAAALAEVTAAGKAVTEADAKVLRLEQELKAAKAAVTKVGNDKGVEIDRLTGEFAEAKNTVARLEGIVTQLKADAEALKGNKASIPNFQETNAQLFQVQSEMVAPRDGGTASIKSMPMGNDLRNMQFDPSSDDEADLRNGVTRGRGSTKLTESALRQLGSAESIDAAEVQQQSEAVAAEVQQQHAVDLAPKEDDAKTAQLMLELATAEKTAKETDPTIALNIKVKPGKNAKNTSKAAWATHEAIIAAQKEVTRLKSLLAITD